MIAQQRYARWLAWGTRVGLGILVIGFALYVTEMLAPHVPIDQLPSLWHHPADEYLRRTGTRGGWSWALMPHRSDMLNIVGIAVLAGCSIPPLAAVIPAFRAKGERAFVVICALEIVVLAAAASGFLAGGH